MSHGIDSLQCNDFLISSKPEHFLCDAFHPQKRVERPFGHLKCMIVAHPHSNDQVEKTLFQIELDTLAPVSPVKELEVPLDIRRQPWKVVTLT